MRRWAFLLRPGWLLLAAVVLAFAYLCFTVLAPWQLGKNTTTSRENAQIAAAVKAEPVALTALLPHQDSSAPADQWRPVTATGHYLPQQQVLVRLQMVAGSPAFEVLVPFVVDGGPTVLVNRGYVRPAEGSRVPPIDPAPEQTVTITGRLRDSQQPMPGREPVVEGGARQVYSISTGQLSQLLGTPLTGSYLQLVDDQPGGLGVLELPHLDAGPFLSYGIQWIAFGIIAPVCLGYFAYSEIKIRRQTHRAAAARDDAAAAEAADSAAAGPADGAVAAAQSPAPAPPRAQTVEEKLADRYGRRR